MTCIVSSGALNSTHSPIGILTAVGNDTVIGRLFPQVESVRSLSQQCPGVKG